MSKLRFLYLALGLLSGVASADTLVDDGLRGVFIGKQVLVPNASDGGDATTASPPVCLNCFTALPQGDGGFYPWSDGGPVWLDGGTVFPDGGGGPVDAGYILIDAGPVFQPVYNCPWSIIPYSDGGCGPLPNQKVVCVHNLGPNEIEVCSSSEAGPENYPPVCRDRRDGYTILPQGEECFGAGPGVLFFAGCPGGQQVDGGATQVGIGR